MLADPADADTSVTFDAHSDALHEMWDLWLLSRSKDQTYWWKKIDSELKFSVYAGALINHGTVAMK